MEKANRDYAIKPKMRSGFIYILHKFSNDIESWSSIEWFVDFQYNMIFTEIAQVE